MSGSRRLGGWHESPPLHRMRHGPRDCGRCRGPRRRFGEGAHPRDDRRLRGGRCVHPVEGGRDRGWRHLPRRPRRRRRRGRAWCGGAWRGPPGDASRGSGSPVARRGPGGRCVGRASEPPAGGHRRRESLIRREANGPWAPGARPSRGGRAPGADPEGLQAWAGASASTRRQGPAMEALEREAPPAIAVAARISTRSCPRTGASRPRSRQCCRRRWHARTARSRRWPARRSRRRA